MEKHTEADCAVALSNHIRTLPDNENLRCPRIRTIKKKFSPFPLPRLRENEYSSGEITSNVNYRSSLHIPFYMSFAINGEKVTVDGSSLGAT